MVASAVTPAARRRVSDFLVLTKPRPMAVVLFTAIAGLVAAQSGIAATTAMLAIVCIALGGAGAAALNMWFERDIDARMERTVSRPLPSGRVSADEALLFAGLLILISIVTMALAAGAAGAVMLSLTIVFYAGVYTMWLKRRSALNAVIGGGIASLLTPLTGWAAASGGLSLEAIALFVFLVPWTPAHVWSQALVRERDYANAGVPMMPVVAGSQRTTRMIVWYTIAHSLAALVPVALGMTGWLWLAVALCGGAALTTMSMQLARGYSGADLHRQAWQFFRWNSIYVIALLLALVIERGVPGAMAFTSIAGLGG